MKGKKIIILVILLFLLIAIAYCMRPLVYTSEENIRNVLMKSTPLGSDKKQVLDFIKTNSYEIDNIVQTPYRQLLLPHNRLGQSYIKTYIGEYQGIPWECDVAAVWVFDSSEKLLYIEVWKQYNAP